MSPLPQRRPPFSPTGTALVDALGLIEAFDLGHPHVHVHSEGACVTFDWTGQLHAGRAVRYACARLGLPIEQHETETPDGQPAVEIRGSSYSGGILRTFRAVEPLGLRPVG